MIPTHAQISLTFSSRAIGRLLIGAMMSVVVLMTHASSARAAPPAKSVAKTSQADTKLDLSGLTTSQRQTFEQIAEDEFCGCDSPLTLQGCLKERPKCRLAIGLGHVLGRLLMAGAPKAPAQAFLSQQVLGPFCSLPAKIDVQDAPVEGAKNADMEVIEFFDYRCTHCKAAQPSLKRAMARFDGRVRLISMPLALVENSVSADAAEAALAAHAQGKFRAMHEALFSREDQNFTPEVLRQVAKKAGLNVKTFEEAMTAHTFAPTVKSFMKRFLALGLDGTPAFFVNGRRFSLEPTVFPLERRIELELERDATHCR